MQLFLWSLFNSDNLSLREFVDILFVIVTLLLVKIYDISITSVICYIVTGIDAYVHNITNYEDMCIAGATRELCESLDITVFLNSLTLSNLTA